MVVQDWKRIRSGDATTFVLTLRNPKTYEAIDVSGATAQEIIFEGPAMQQVKKTSMYDSDGTDGKIKCTLSSDDLQQVGTWKMQAHVTLASGYEYRSEVVEIEVERAL